MFNNERLTFNVREFSYISNAFTYEDKPCVSNKLECLGVLSWDIEDDMEIVGQFEGKDVIISLQEKYNEHYLKEEYRYGVFKLCENHVDLRLAVYPVSTIWTK